MKNARPRNKLLLATLMLATAAPSALFAQEGTGVRGVLTFDQDLEFSDNKRLLADPLGTTLTPVTRLGFGLSSDTRVDRFDFGADITIEKSFGEGALDTEDDLRISGEAARLFYERTGSNSRLSFRGSVTQREVEDDFEGFFDDGDFDRTALVIDNGDVRRTNYGLTFETGIAGPFGFELTTRNFDRRYFDTEDPELTDLDRFSVDAVARFRIRPALAIRAIAGIGDEEETGDFVTQTDDFYIGIGVESETASGLAIRGDVLVDETQRTINGIEDNLDDGFGFDISVRQASITGAYGFDLSSRIDGAGRRTSASVNRAIDLPTGGFSFSLGLVDQEDGDVGIIGSLDFIRDIPLGQITASVNQAPSTDIDEAFLNTSVNLGLRRELTSVSALGATFRYGSSATLSGGDEDADTRATLGLTYERELTRDWGLTAGYEYTRVDDAGEDAASSNTVFLSIGRDFDFGF